LKKNKQIKKKIAIKRTMTRFNKKNWQNQTTRDEIKNKIQLETINVNKKITIKRRKNESKEKKN
jgi:hypothetical protein